MMFARRCAAPPSASVLGQEVPGPYTVASDVAPLRPEQCGPGGRLFQGGALCCIEVGFSRWRCRSVSGGAAATPTPSSGSADTCLRAIQIGFVEEGRLDRGLATGRWNPETEAALAQTFPSPRTYAGGPCAMLALMTLRPTPPIRAGIFPTGLQDINAGTVALAAAAIAALFFVAKSRGPA